MEKYTLVNYSNMNGCTSYFKLICNYKKEKKEKEYTYNDITKNEEIERISLSRTKRNIKEIALCNDFEYFVTLTIDSELCDRFSLTECQTRLRKIFKRIKRKYENFRYLFITERHKDGAFHFHGLIGGYNNFYINSNGYLSSVDFDNLGFNSFSKIHNYNKCCNYIMKYITKECVRNENNQIYISSRGLKKAEREEILPIDFSKFLNISNGIFENEYCKIIEFSADDLTQEQKLYFMNNVKNAKCNRNVIDINYII